MAKPAKHSVTLAGHRTSVTLEAEFWQSLKEIARSEGCSLGEIVGEIDKKRIEDGAVESNLSSALRVFILEWYKNEAGKT